MTAVNPIKSIIITFVTKNFPNLVCHSSLVGTPKNSSTKYIKAEYQLHSSSLIKKCSTLSLRLKRQWDIALGLSIERPSVFNIKLQQQVCTHIVQTMFYYCLLIALYQNQFKYSMNSFRINIKLCVGSKMGWKLTQYSSYHMMFIKVTITKGFLHYWIKSD